VEVQPGLQAARREQAPCGVLWQWHDLWAPDERGGLLHRAFRRTSPTLVFDRRAGGDRAVGDFNPFRFEGRIGRLQYFGFGVIWWLIILVVVALTSDGFDAVAGPSAGSAFSSFVLMVIYFIATLSYGVRRLHDFDKSGWWYLVSFVPLVNFVMALILLFAAGTPGANGYGARSRTLHSAT
jgi:uncharacterized membrane protein YhaH (DUF805 family)